MSVHRYQRTLALLCTAAVVSMAPASPAFAQRRAPVAVIESFKMDPIARIEPGAELFFRVQGTPGANVSVRIEGLSRTVFLREGADGQYEGSYVVKSDDRLSRDANASATLRYRNRSSTVSLDRLLPNVAVGGQGQRQQGSEHAHGTPAIERFEVSQVDQIDPGTELKFELHGTPGARATFVVEGTALSVGMRESSPGHYEGSYTVRRGDRIAPNAAVTATVEANGRKATSKLGQTLVKQAKALDIRNMQPPQGQTVPAGAVSISGTFENPGRSRIDPRTVRILVQGRDVTQQATVTHDFFNYRTELQPGGYSVDVSARDTLGATIHAAWDFQVRGAAAPAQLVLDVTSHRDQATVDSGRVEVSGRATPGATIDVQVTGVASLGGLFGFNQPIYNERVTADNSGRFSFAFSPTLPIPGMRYEVSLKASKDGREKETKLMLNPR